MKLLSGTVLKWTESYWVLYKQLALSTERILISPFVVSLKILTELINLPPPPAFLDGIKTALDSEHQEGRDQVCPYAVRIPSTQDLHIKIYRASKLMNACLHYISFYVQIH